MNVANVPPALLRRMVWDIVADDKIPGYSSVLGLTPASPDVDEEEKLAAHRRIQRIRPIVIPFVMMTSVASDILTRTLFIDMGMEADEEDIEKVNWVIQAGCQAVIAEMLDLRILQHGPVITGGMDFL